MAYEFEIVRTPLYPYIYSLNVNYLDSVDQNILLEKLSKYQSDPVTLKAILPLLVTFKQSKFQSEEEIRIVTQYSKEFYNFHCLDEFNLNFYLDSNNKLQYFVKLPFLYENEDIPNKSNSLLRLKKSISVKM